jgi:glycosyltransferase involved in cell wall biosynthesis
LGNQDPSGILEEIVRAGDGNGKVCIMTSVHPPFDPRIFHKEAQTLVQAGYEVVLIAPYDKESTSVDGVQIMGLPRYKRRLYRPLNWWRILRTALRQKADVYHFHDPELLPVGLLIKVLSGRPTIYDVHENYPERILTKEWIPTWLRRVTSVLFRYLENSLASFIDALVAVNDKLAERFSEKGQVVTVANYLRIEEKASGLTVEATYGLKRGSYLVYAGLIAGDRGISQCIRAFETLKRNDLHFVCAGRVDETAPPELRAILDGSTPAPRFHYLGLLPYEAIPGLLQNALVGLLCFQPTPNNILGTPNKLFEYMGAGIPVIASGFPYIREVISSAECGILVDPTSTEEISTAMHHLLNHLDEAVKMGENGRRAVKERYNWESEGRKLLRLYEELLSAR